LLIKLINMKNNFSIDLLSLLKSKYIKTFKTVPLTDKIGLKLFNALTMNNVLSQGRVVKLALRVKHTNLFLAFILKYKKYHGDEATVKWIKAGLVSIQKELGQDRMKSMIILGIPHNMSLLQRGLPRIIPASSRLLMRRGDVKEIRFWTGLFNIYRVIKITGKIKLETITDPISTSLETLNNYLSMAKDFRPFHLLEGFNNLNMKLAPIKVFNSSSASPSNKVSIHGWLSDLWLLKNQHPRMFKHLLEYLALVQSGSNKEREFINTFEDSINLINKFYELSGLSYLSAKGFIRQSNFLRLKPSVELLKDSLDNSPGISQFAIKEEAAGKIRLFALLDSVTQTFLAPLHQVLFDILKSIPNDGTFDQEASIKRSQSKALSANCAYSFDLTAATDRLPAKLTSLVIETIVSKEIGNVWLNIMTDRGFWFNDKVANKLGISSGPYTYAVGQPMGGLSSWAGLAITHHWVVQLASFNVYQTLSWNLNYEILGDDLVIFDAKLADEYLKIMQDLGCEINLNKSIISKSRPVFEFAKRLCWGNHIVSGISLNQIMAGNSIGARITNVLAFANSGLITSLSLLAITLSKYTFRKGISSSKLIFEKKGKGDKFVSLSVLAILGSLVNKHNVSLEDLMISLINPNKSIAHSTAVAIQSSMKLVLSMLNKPSDPNGPGVKFSEFFSKFEQRKEAYSELHSSLVRSIVDSLTEQANDLAVTYQELVRSNSRNLVSPYIYEEQESGKYYEEVDWIDLPDYIQELYNELDLLSYRIFNVDPSGADIDELIDKLYAFEDQDDLVIGDLNDILDPDFKSAALIKNNKVTKDLELKKVLDLQAELEQLLFKISPPVPKKEPGKFILETAPAIALLKRELRFRNKSDDLELNPKAMSANKDWEKFYS
jgi:hypothetical protein